MFGHMAYQIQWCLHLTTSHLSHMVAAENEIYTYTAVYIINKNSQAPWQSQKLEQTEQPLDIDRQTDKEQLKQKKMRPINTQGNTRD